MKYRMVVFEDDAVIIQKRYRFWPFWMQLYMEHEIMTKIRELSPWWCSNTQHFRSVDAAQTALSMWLDQEDKEAKAKRKVRSVPVDIYLSTDLDPDKINEVFG